MNINIVAMENLESGLYIIATPIGNLEDITKRAAKTLSMVDLIICENPIHSLKLLNNLGIKKKLLSLHDYNEEILIKRIEKYQQNSSIALISDAGSPLISDPGYKLVRNYIEKKLTVTTVPGPSSIIPALQLSGIAINNFEFFGFVSRNKKTLDSSIEKVANSQTTSIFFVSGSRLLDFLEKLLNHKIDKKISISKEITKKNERVFRGNIFEVIKDISLDKKNLKGEFVVVIGGKEKKENKIININIKNQISNLLKKFTLTEVVEIVHKLTSISKKEVYKTTLLLKND
jgi:16S rRNA (cytidine1402-2'-O)-methyltransferase